MRKHEAHPGAPVPPGSLGEGAPQQLQRTGIARLGAELVRNCKRALRVPGAGNRDSEERRAKHRAQRRRDPRAELLVERPNRKQQTVPDRPELVCGEREFSFVGEEFPEQLEELRRKLTEAGFLLLDFLQQVPKRSRAAAKRRPLEAEEEDDARFVLGSAEHDRAMRKRALGGAWSEFPGKVEEFCTEAMAARDRAQGATLVFWDKRNDVSCSEPQPLPRQNLSCRLHCARACRRSRPVRREERGSRLPGNGKRFCALRGRLERAAPRGRGCEEDRNIRPSEGVGDPELDAVRGQRAPRCSAVGHFLLSETSSHPRGGGGERAASGGAPQVISRIAVHLRLRR